MSQTTVTHHCPHCGSVNLRKNGTDDQGQWTTSEQKVALRKSITSSFDQIPDYNAILVAKETLQRLPETTDSEHPGNFLPQSPCR